MSILSIQSQVIYGHVGNSTAQFALQRMGHEVMALPTGLLSFHPGHGKPAARVTPADELRATVAALKRIDMLAGCQALLTGWLGSAENADAVLDAAADLRAASPRALWLCDPVIGDTGTGVYVAADLAIRFRDRLVPAADIVTPNQFELEWLLERRIDSLPTALEALRLMLARGPKIVVCTSLRRADRTPGLLDTMVATADGAWLASTPDLQNVPNGGGDTFAAVFLARLLKGKSPKKAMAYAVAAVYGILRQTVTQGRREPLLVAAQSELVRPTFNPQVERVA